MWNSIILNIFVLIRLLLAVLVSCYRVDVVDGEERRYFAFPPHIAPVKVVVLPLLKNKPLIVEKSERVYDLVLANFACEYDAAGAIGRRYRRADEAGTPFCVTIDFESLEDECVTVRDRDTTIQARIKLENLVRYLSEKINKN